MTEELFDDPAMQARITEEVYRIESKWQQAITVNTAFYAWPRHREKIQWIFDDELVAMLVAKLDACARNYLDAIDSSSLLPEFSHRLRQVGAALIREAEQRGWVRNPFTEDEFRQMAESTLIVQDQQGTPKELGSVLQQEVARLRDEFLAQRTRWNEWRTRIINTIETSFEERYAHWAAEGERHASVLRIPPAGVPAQPIREANERGATNQRPASAPVVRETETPGSSTDAEPPKVDLGRIGDTGGPPPSNPAPGTAVAPVGWRSLFDDCILKMDAAGHRISRADISTVAGYRDSTELERLQRGHTPVNKTAVRKFRQVLAREPDEFMQILRAKKHQS